MIKVILIVGILYASAIFIYFTIGSSGQKDIYCVDDGWYVQINDQAYENVKLSEFSFPVTQYGDTIILKNYVPTGKMRNILLKLWICHATVEVRLADSIKYSYGHLYADRGELTGSGYHWIPLPYGCQGTEFTIKFHFTENNVVSTIEPIYFGESSDLVFDFLRQNFYVILVGNFLMVIGVVGFLFVSILYRHNGLLNRLIHIFFFCVLYGNMDSL